MHYDNVTIKFSIDGDSVNGVDSQGNPIKYTTQGKSRTFYYCPETHESCFIDCSTTSPEKKSLYAIVSGSISLSVSDNFGTHEIKVDSQSFSCQILEK